MPVTKPSVVPRWADGGSNTATNVVQPPENTAAIPTWIAGVYAVGAPTIKAGKQYVVTAILGTGTSTTGPTGTGTTIDNPGANQVTWAFVAVTPVTKDAGWLPNVQPPAQWFNWLFFTIYSWILWLQDIANQNFTSGGVGPWSNFHTFSKTVAFNGGLPGAGNGAIIVTPGAGSDKPGALINGDGIGDGVQGVAPGTGNGVLGTSAAGLGVAGIGGTDSAGVQGQGTGLGAGVQGFGGSNDSAPGVLGVGKFGFNSDGVRGNSHGTGNGVKGTALGSGPGVYGTSSTGPGVQGLGGTGGAGGSFAGGSGFPGTVNAPGSGTTIASQDNGLSFFADSFAAANPVKTLDCGINAYGAPHISKAWGTIHISGAGAVTWDGVGIASVTLVTSPTNAIKVTLSHAMATSSYGVTFGLDDSAFSGTNFYLVRRYSGASTQNFFYITYWQVASGVVSQLNPAGGITLVDFEVMGRHV